MPLRDAIDFLVPLRGLQTQARVVRALFMREIITRFGRRNIGFAWLFVEPFLYVLVITAIWTATRDIHQSSIPVAAFTLTGYCSMLLWRNPPSRCMGVLQSNQALLFHRQVTMLDIYFARYLLEFTGVSTSFLVLAVLFWGTGYLEVPENLLQVIAGWLLLAMFGLSLALALGPLSERLPSVQKLWSPTPLILFLFSGTSFLLDWMPPGIRYWLMWLPMANGLEYMREGWFGSYFKPHYDIGYMIEAILILTVFGLIQTRRIGVNEIRFQ